ncbi:MAG: AbrB/MazE/SpoVT family DNA-binding domain-containing protein [Candidatus Kerfeldbacteria bacterium]|nr:AbrB/MazE/SpoVT family DNA-binding domain-containing protein [Candidatus Kerfeldbacteria bacterium]
MSIVKVTSQFRVTIPRSIRKSLALKPGMKLSVTADRFRLTLIPVRRNTNTKIASAARSGLAMTAPR